MNSRIRDFVNKYAIIIYAYAIEIMPYKWMCHMHATFKAPQNAYEIIYYNKLYTSNRL